ncbi:MAG: hypothetical protein IT270_14340 [Saprospiraceae bacterium]|nr:hypothetical protein [Saprospiraceae bacterium]
MKLLLAFLLVVISGWFSPGLLAQDVSDEAFAIPLEHQKHFIKMEPLEVLWGYFPVYYEYAINHRLGLQAGVGPTFKPVANKFQSNVYSVVYSGDCGGFDCSNYYDYAYRENIPGYMILLSPRLYFPGGGLKGSYVGPDFKWIQKYSKAQKPDPDIAHNLIRLEDEYDDENILFLDMLINFGFQKIYGSGLLIDYSLGVGLRTIFGNWQYIQQVGNGYYISSTPYRQYNQLHIDFGLKIGLGM